jgi:chorismate synthase
MAGNTFGTIFTVSTFGESHGPAVGCVVDGCPAGLSLDVEDIKRELRRRRPAGNPASTSRREADEPEILSGLFEGKTLGTPIAIIIRNNDRHSSDYEELRDLYRPGHADWAWEAKYGIRDHRGGGRSSGRETACRVAAGALAKVFLASRGIGIRAWTSSIAGLNIPRNEDFGEIEKNPLRLPRADYVEKALKKIEALKAEGDSAGGAVSCSVTGLPPGLGEPVFGKLDALIAGAMLSIGAAKGIEFGAGFGAAELKGSENNDTPAAAETRRPEIPEGTPDLSFKTNNSGGVLGGISTGMPLEFTVAFKPVPSISKAQQSAGRDGTIRELVIRGRHDVCIVPRAVPVVEAMTALVLADLVLINRGSRV